MRIFTTKQSGAATILLALTYAELSCRVWRHNNRRGLMALHLRPTAVCT